MRTSGSGPGRASRAAQPRGRRAAAPTLSTSSSMITGFIPASREGADDRPGARRCSPPVPADLPSRGCRPRTSDELAVQGHGTDSRSRSCPPRAARRASGPRPSACPRGIPRSLRSFRTARYSTIRSLTSSRPAWSASSTPRASRGRAARRSASHHGTAPASRGTCGRADDHRPARPPLQPAAPAPPARALRPAWTPRRSSRDTPRRPTPFLAELLADRIHCLRRRYSRCCCLSPRLDVLADAAAHLELGEPLSVWSSIASWSCSTTSTVSSRAHLLLEGEVGRAARGVRERPRLRNRADEARDGSARPLRAARGSPRRRPDRRVSCSRVSCR